jgi:pterin-4a-carbinolamine dehydratase
MDIKVTFNSQPLTTHVADGLTNNDFIMARIIDEVRS